MGGEGDDRGWHGWTESRTQWRWVWVSSGSWWWTGRPRMLQSMGLQRVGHDWVMELNWMPFIRFSKEYGKTTGSYQLLQISKITIYFLHALDCVCSDAKSSLTLFWLHGLQPACQAPLSMDFSRQECCRFLLQGSSWPRNGNVISCIHRQILDHWATREAHRRLYVLDNKRERQEAFSRAFILWWTWKAWKKHRLGGRANGLPGERTGWS